MKNKYEKYGIELENKGFFKPVYNIVIKSIISKKPQIVPHRTREQKKVEVI